MASRTLPPTGSIVGRMLRWYFLQQPIEIVRGYGAYASALASFFSVMFLLRTLVAPWKSIRDAYPRSRLLLSDWLQTLTLNLTARGVGMVIRIFALVSALILQVLLFLCAVVYLLGWLLFPVWALAGFFSFLYL